MNAAPSPRLALVLVVLSLAMAAGVAGVALVTQPATHPPPPARAEQTSARPPARHHDRPPARRTTRHTTRRSPTQDPERSVLMLVARLMALSTMGGVLVSGVVTVAVVRRRIRNRRTRMYGRYEIKLTAHDETKPEDLEETVETIAGIVREHADQRWRNGQPHWALELHYGPTASGMEWTACLLCEPKVVKQLDAALASAYPDVRVGHEFDNDPRPIAGTLRTPRHVERFRKHRMFIYALGRDGVSVNANRVGGAPLMEHIARCQEAAGNPSSVRLTFTPTMHAVEALAAKLMGWQENRSARAERWGATEAGLRSQHRQDELRNAQRTQNRSLFWFEALVASDDPHTAKAVSAALQAFRGENRLHRRRGDLRPNRTRRRFVTGQPPLLPMCWFNWLAPPLTMIFSLRTLVSSAEVTRLVELPTARLKGVPLRRLMLPRIPAPPDALRADDTHPDAPEDHDAFDETSVHPRTTTTEKTA